MTSEQETGEEEFIQNLNAEEDVEEEVTAADVVGRLSRLYNECLIFY